MQNQQADLLVMITIEPQLTGRRVCLHRFETERPINIASPASAATSVEDHGLSDKSAPSLGQLQFAVSHARGMQATALHHACCPH